MIVLIQLVYGAALVVVISGSYLTIAVQLMKDRSFLATPVE